MKFTKIALSLALMGIMSLGMAEDATTSADTTVSIDAQIEAIQTAPAEERVELMNQFKQQLMQMNQEQRASAIAALQEKMQASGMAFGAQTHEDAQMAQESTKMMGDAVHTRATEHAQEMQMQANEMVNQMQNMHQIRVGNQMANMPSNPPVHVAPAAAQPGGGANMNFNMPASH
jgi:uncharacterized protein YPO0396